VKEFCKKKRGVFISLKILHEDELRGRGINEEEKI